MAVISHKFIFETPERALLFVRQVFATCADVATFRDDVVVLVLDAHRPPQTDKLVKLAQKLGSSSVPPPLPSERISRSPTLPEPEPDGTLDIDVKD